MRRLFTISMFALAAPAVSQEPRHATTGVSTEASSAITAVYNASGTRRERGAFEVARDSTIQGSLAVRVGPLRVAGHVTGDLVIINSDVTFLAGAHVDGNVYLLGGTATGRDQAVIGGDFHQYSETLRYRMRGEELIIESAGERTVHARSDDDFWNRERGHTPSTSLDFFAVAGSNAYNRVEGFPIRLGPQFRMRRDWGSLSISARAIVRTAEPMSWGRSTIGHDMRTEVRAGTGAGVGIGLSAFDRVDAVESWHLNDNEAALAAALIHRDYRDYYGRHGGRAFVTGYLNDDISLTAAYGTERWESRAERDPWTLFRGHESWRDNPAVDDGRAHLLTGALKIDTRNQTYAPGAGWFVRADIEHATFNPDRTHSLIPVDGGVPLDRTYTRGFLDARRYNRLAPGAQLNVRVVLGGWMNGDELPLERRVSVGGPGTLPGFDFRKHTGDGVDRLQCSATTGPAENVPVLCDRVALMQIEYRGDISWRTRGGRERRWLVGDIGLPAWMVFADMGRGWRAHSDGATDYPVESFPALSTFKTDIGVGLDFGALSISLAKSMSDREEPMNLVLRLNRRF